MYGKYTVRIRYFTNSLKSGDITRMRKQRVTGLPLGEEWYSTIDESSKHARKVPTLKRCQDMKLEKLFRGRSRILKRGRLLEELRS